MTNCWACVNVPEPPDNATARSTGEAEGQAGDEVSATMRFFMWCFLVPVRSGDVQGDDAVRAGLPPSGGSSTRCGPRRGVGGRVADDALDVAAAGRERLEGARVGRVRGIVGEEQVQAAGARNWFLRFSPAFGLARFLDSTPTLSCNCGLIV